MTSCRAVLPALTECRGAIVNVTSISARSRGSAGGGVYAAAKGLASTYTRAYTRALATALAPLGVRVNAVSPGVTATRFHELCSTPEGLEAPRRRIPPGRLGTSEGAAPAPSSNSPRSA